MSLNDREHVEAVAIIRRLIDSEGQDEQARLAAAGWLRENHPTPDEYAAAVLAEQEKEQRQ